MYITIFFFVHQHRQNTDIIDSMWRKCCHCHNALDQFVTFVVTQFYYFSENSWSHWLVLEVICYQLQSKFFDVNSKNDFVVKIVSSSYFQLNFCCVMVTNSHTSSGVDFTNILLEAFSRADPKAQKIQSSCQSLALLGSALVKAACKMFGEIDPRRCWTQSLINQKDSLFADLQLHFWNALKIVITLRNNFLKVPNDWY